MNGANVAVIGAGSIGGILAARLGQGGHDPVLVCKHVDTLEMAQAPGLHIFGVSGEATQSVRAVLTVEDLPDELDYVFHATKATDMLGAAQALLPKLHGRSLVVSLQNGICEEALAGVLGRERVAGCVVGFGATMHGPARLEMTSPGEFVLGGLVGEDDPRLEAARQMLATVVPCRITKNIMGELYAKLIINSCINSLGAVTGMYLGQMLAKARARRLFVGVMREAMAVARAMHVKVEKGAGGKLDYQEFLSSGALAGLKRDLMIRIIGFKYRRLKSSSLQSLERNKPTEIQYLNGYIVDKAREAGIPVPVNQGLVAMVSEIEAGSRRIDPANLDALPLG